MNLLFRQHRSSRQHGLSLIELMVGMLVSMICVLAIMSAFGLYEGQKRTTTSGDDAQQNGSFSLYDLSRQIRTGGSGLTQGYQYGLWGCSMTAYQNNTKMIPATAALPAPFTTWPGTSPVTPVNMFAMPVLIQAGGADAQGNALPDAIAVVGGDSSGTVFKSVVQSTPSASSVVLDNALGINANDYLLATTTTAGSCVVVQASTVTLSTNTVTLAASNGPTTGLIGGQYVFDMGPSPTFNLYGVDTTTNSLVVYDLLQRSGASPVQLADGIVTIKALYGVDDGASTSIPGSGQVNDGIIDEWVQPTGAWSINTLVTESQSVLVPQIREIKAIRIVIVARSQLPEKSTDYTGQNTLTLFSDLPTGLRYTITTQPQYRYKIYDTTIPIHNTIINKWM